MHARMVFHFTLIAVLQLSVLAVSVQGNVYLSYIIINDSLNTLAGGVPSPSSLELRLKNDPGIKVIVGPDGLQGQDGMDGHPGPRGDPGHVGAPGRPGRPAAIGEKGAKGDPGVIGPSGIDGFPGRRGSDGGVGRPGPIGEPGMEGDPGRYIFTWPPPHRPIPGRKGYRGPKGPPGLPGISLSEPGAKGYPGLPGDTTGGGVSYIRWGSSECRVDSDLVYSGKVGGSTSGHQGGGGDYLCLPKDPEYTLASKPGQQEHSTVEDTIYINPIVNGSDMRNPTCAACFTLNRSVVVMIPGKTVCPSLWTMEYRGYLMSEGISNWRTMYECIDERMEGVPESESSDVSGSHIYHVEASCDELGCPPYDGDKELACVVCSK